jgi:hypothetical protein
MDEWTMLPVTQLKKLVKSRAGRIAELQMEVKILEGVIERKVREGDLGGSAPKQAGEKAEKPGKEAKESPKGEAEEAETPEEEKPEQSKIKEKSSEHAFKEID